MYRGKSKLFIQRRHISHKRNVGPFKRISIQPANDVLHYYPPKTLPLMQGIDGDINNLQVQHAVTDYPSHPDYAFGANNMHAVTAVRQCPDSPIEGSRREA